MRLSRSIHRPFAIFMAGLVLTGCAGAQRDEFALRSVPEVDEYCLAAQRLVTRTDVPVELVLHADFQAFVRSKAVIDGPAGPQIQQYNWVDASGRLTGISCKLKSADHLNLRYGEGSAGPDGRCQSMNEAVFALVAPTVRNPAYSRVVFDPLESVSNDDEPGMTGPDWLAPFTMSYADDAAALHIASKGFVVNFTDPAFAEAPPRFRGVHYCHFVAPDYLLALLRGEAGPETQIGRLVDLSGPNPGPAR